MIRTLLTFIAFAQFAQAQQRLTPSQATFRSDSRLVLVRVHVTDRRGAGVAGLQPQDFSVFANKTQQTILSFSEEDVPCSVGVIFDLSGSMTDRLPAAKQALKAFFDLASPDDRAMLISVSDQPKLRTGFTNDYGTLLAGLSMERAAGNTSLVDSIYQGISIMKRSPQARRALLIVSDGMDNHSRYSQSDVQRLSIESGIEIHTIAISDSSANKKAIQLQEERRGLEFMQTLAATSGGLYFVVRDEKEMRAATERVGVALRSQYVIGFRPNSALDGRRHRLQIKMTEPSVQAHARSEYLSE